MVLVLKWHVRDGETRSMHFSMPHRTMDMPLSRASLTWQSGLQMSVAGVVEAEWTRTWHSCKGLTIAYAIQQLGQRAGLTLTRDRHLSRGSLHVWDCSTCCTSTHREPPLHAALTNTFTRTEVAPKHACNSGSHIAAPARAHEQAGSEISLTMWPAPGSPPLMNFRCKAWQEPS